MQTVSSLTITLRWLNQTCTKKESSGWMFPRFKQISLGVCFFPGCFSFAFRYVLWKNVVAHGATKREKQSAFVVNVKQLVCLIERKTIWNIEFAASMLLYHDYNFIRTYTLARIGAVLSAQWISSVSRALILIPITAFLILITLLFNLKSN